MQLKGLQKPNDGGLPLNLSRQFWQALAQVASGLSALASVALQENPSNSGLSLSPTPPPAPPASPPAPPRRTAPATDFGTVAEGISDFLRAKARAGRSDRYLRTLRVSLGSFADGRRSTLLAEIAVHEIEQWLDDQSGWAPRTKRGYLKDVRTLYNFAVRRGLAPSNPANAVELPALDNTPPGVHTPDQAAAVLDLARQGDLNLCRCLAIRYFAGLRSSEAERLAESEIKLDQGLIEVTAAKAKTRSRRLVAISPNLRAWLALGGELPLHDVNNRCRLFTARLAQQRGVPWPQNVTRHSYISYHLAAFGNAGKTALEAGNSEAMIFKHYRALVTPTAAAAYWAILPKENGAGGEPAPRKCV